MGHGNTTHPASADSEALAAEIAALKSRVADLERNAGPVTGLDIICFSNDWDRLFAAFALANGALALGQEVHLFFTFWAISALRRPDSHGGRLLAERIVSRMLPRGHRAAPLSRWNCCGLGRKLLRRVMRRKGIDDLDALIESARELGAHFYLCETTAELLGVGKDDLVDCENVDCCGVATFLATARQGHMVLFI